MEKTMLAPRVESASGLGQGQEGHTPVHEAGAACRDRARRRPRVLMVCTLFTLPYRVMRCVEAAGSTVHVLGNEGALGFRFSRFVSSFHQAQRPFDGNFDDAMADEVNDCIQALDIDIVLAGDQPSARSLIGIRPRLKARCFPMPDLATFDLLNDKWAFFQLCQTIGVRCPPTRLHADRASLWDDIQSGGTTLPCIAKPLSLDGSRGVVVLREKDASRQLDLIRYDPVLVQTFVDGVDIGASAFCEAGQLRAFILHRLARATYTAFAHADVLDAVARIARATSYTGVANFDMRLAPDGTVFFLECNPRFFYKMDLSMVAGVNFAAYGLGGDVAPNFVEQSQVRMPKALLANLPAPWRLTARDWRMLWHLYSDPLSYAREALRIDWEDRSY